MQTQQMCPSYLSGQSALWARDPHAANLAWFRDARFGLFIHYGLYSQLQRGEWCMVHDRIPLPDYERLAATFDPSGFDADRITDLACEAGMRYVTLTTCHHDGFCLYDSAIEPFNSVTRCGRDLFAELAEQCDRKGLGCFGYCTHMVNWRHPESWMAQAEWNVDVQPGEAPAMPFWQWSQACIREVCRLPWPLAGVWLDGIMGYYRHPERVPIASTYELIRRERPAALIAFKQGATGDEDFAAPEHRFASLGPRLRTQGHDAAAERADGAWQKNRDKHNEICASLQDGAWGYDARARHRSADEVLALLAHAAYHDGNLLLNVGPVADGSFHPDDVACLREVGRRIRTQGWPQPSHDQIPSEITDA